MARETCCRPSRARPRGRCGPGPGPPWPSAGTDRHVSHGHLGHMLVCGDMSERLTCSGQLEIPWWRDHNWRVKTLGNRLICGVWSVRGICVGSATKITRSTPALRKSTTRNNNRRSAARGGTRPLRAPWGSVVELCVTDLITVTVVYMPIIISLMF